MTTYKTKWEKIILNQKLKEACVQIKYDQEHIRLEDAFPEESEDSIREMYNKLERGQAAWVMISVSASAFGLTERDSLGGCWIEGDYTIDSCVDENHMIDNALRELSKSIEKQYIELKKIFEE